MDFSNLQSRVSAAYVPPHKTQLHPRMHFPSRFPKPSSSSQSRHNLWIAAASFLLVLFLFYLFSIGRGIHQSSKFDEQRPRGFGLIINAGRFGSRIHVFEFLNQGMIPFDDGKGSVSFMVRPGLAEFESDPDNAGSSILSLVEFGKKKVPKLEWKETKLWLMASEGIQMVDFEAREAILESCRRVLRSSGFQFKDEWASVITGQEEGLYAWLAANYALGTLGGDPGETTGIVELGGASVQVTFASRKPLSVEFSRILKIAGITYNLYAQSIPQISQDMAWESLLDHSKLLSSSLNSSDRSITGPCIPKGYGGSADPSEKKLLASNSAGNFAACRSEVSAYLHKRNDECSQPPCISVSSFFPKFQGKPLFPGNFFYTSKFFGLIHKASLSEVEAAGHHYCEDDWSKLKDEHKGVDEMELLRYCFSSAYILALLNNSLGVPMDEKRIGFAGPAGGVPMDWTLGAFILQTVLQPRELEPENLGGIVGNNSVTYFSFFAIVLFAFLGAFYASRLWKPQLKTVYDLEKGQYIITRGPR